MAEKNILDELYSIIENRRDNPLPDSYTSYLFEKGIDKILKKIGEESSEVIIASKNKNNEEIILEISDLLYHVMVLMAEAGIKISDIKEELESRRTKILNKKPEREEMPGIH